MRIQKNQWFEKLKLFFRADILRESNKRVAAENMRMLYLVNAAFTGFSLFLYIYFKFEEDERFRDGIYVFFVMVSIVTFFILKFIIEKKRKYIPAMILADYVMLNIYLVWIGIICHRDMNVTSFYILMGLSFCFLIRPMSLILLQVITGFVFSILCYILKPFEIAELDIINSMMMMVMSSVLGCAMIRFRMNSLTRLEQKDQALKVRELYQSILDETQTAVVVHDINTGEMFYGNRMLQEIYGDMDDTDKERENSDLYQERALSKERIAAIYNDENDTKQEEVEYRRQTGKYYKVKGKRIDWCGRDSYVEYITDVTDSKKFSEQLQSAHDELKRKYQEEVLYRENTASSDIIATSRVNLSHGYVEEMRIGTEEGFEKEYHYAVDFATRIAAYTNEIWLDQNQNRNMSPEILLHDYSNGIVYHTESFVAELKDGKHVWIKEEVKLLERPDTGEIIAFFYSRNISKEKILSDILEKIMYFGYDEIYTIDSVNGLVTAVAQGKYALKTQIKEGNYEEEIADLVERTESKTAKMQMKEDCSLENIQNQLKKKKVFVKEASLKSRNGKYRRKQMRFVYLNEDVGIILFTLSDIEELVKEEKEKQERLEEALQMAEEANATKTSFLARMSHEIRTPMNAIIGLTSIVKEEANQPENVLDCADKLDSASRYLLALLNDILDMSRIESGNVVIQHQPFELSKFWNSVNTLAHAQAAPAHIEYVFEQKYGQTDEFIGDAIRLQQIMVNLINNAIKFTPAGGSVKVSVQILEQVNRKCKLCVKVSDTGIGISKEFLPDIFKVFTQEHDGNTNSYGGSGLGLSIAKNYANMMGGDIFVESELGKGTTFTVEVLLEQDENQSHTDKKIRETKQITEKTFEGKRVLLVEDHPLNTMVASRLLVKKGFEVVHAENGKKAVEEFEKSGPGDFDVILMDIRMPVMDGMEAAGKIRNLDRRDALTVPIIAMTANAYDDDRRKTREAGMNAHLAKPIDPQVLFQVLSEFMK